MTSNLEPKLQYPGETYTGFYTTKHIEEELVPTLESGLLAAAKGDTPVEAVFQYAVTSKFPVPALKYLLDQTFRSNRFLNRIILPNEKLPKQPIGSIKRGTHPLHLEDRLYGMNNKDWLIGYNFVEPIDPATRLLGYMLTSATFRNEGVDEKYYARKVVHTSVETIEEIKAVLKPWATMNAVLNDLVAQSGYDAHIGPVQFSYSVGVYNIVYQNIVTTRAIRI